MKNKRKTREKKPLSFAIYVMGAFLLTAAMTVLITAAAIAIVWNVGYAGAPSDEEIFAAVLISGAIALVLSIILGLYFAIGIARPLAALQTPPRRSRKATSPLVRGLVVMTSSVNSANASMRWQTPSSVTATSSVSSSAT